MKLAALLVLGVGLMFWRITKASEATLGSPRHDAAYAVNGHDGALGDKIPVEQSTFPDPPEASNREKKTPFTIASLSQNLDGMLV